MHSRQKNKPGSPESRAKSYGRNANRNISTVESQGAFLSIPRQMAEAVVQ